jgi:hypothetical protein
MISARKSWIPAEHAVDAGEAQARVQLAGQALGFEIARASQGIQVLDHLIGAETQTARHLQPQGQSSATRWGVITSW